MVIVLGQVNDVTFFVKTNVSSRKIALRQWRNDRICQLFDIFLMIFQKIDNRGTSKTKFKIFRVCITQNENKNDRSMIYLFHQKSHNKACIGHLLPKFETFSSHFQDFTPFYVISHYHNVCKNCRTL